MQTLSIPYTISDEHAAILKGWRMRQSRVVRSAYVAAATVVNGVPVFSEEKTVRDGMKARFSCSPTDGEIDAWLLHCGVRDAFTLRKAHPEGRLVFGSKALFERRLKGLVDNAAWKAARVRPLVSIGDKTQKGNRHVRLSADGTGAIVSVYGRSVELRLTTMVGKWARLLEDVAMLADLGEISVTFRVGRKLEVSFDEMDLRKLPVGKSLQATKDDELAVLGHKGRGRPRGANYVAPVSKWTAENPRPVHPEWLDRIPTVEGRCLGIDLNPARIGLTLVENVGDLHALSNTTVLSHRMIELDLPSNASNEVVRESLAKVCNLAISQARAFGAGVIAIERGLGKLRSGGRNRSLNRLLNHWCRTVFVQMLTRRAKLAGITIVSVWSGYSTTIGNLSFPLPDACAAAGEIARRGLIASTGVRQVPLPTYVPRVAPGLWKDRDLLAGEGILANAAGWVEAHRNLKTAKLGVRRPHPVLGPDSDARTACGHAVRRLGHRNRPGRVYRMVEVAGKADSTVERRVCSTVESE